MFVRVNEPEAWSMGDTLLSPRVCRAFEMSKAILDQYPDAVERLATELAARHV